MPDIYINLDHSDYKRLEANMRDFKETVHTSVDGFYHKSIRINVGEIVFEFHGPAVKAGERPKEDETLYPSSVKQLSSTDAAAIGAAADATDAAAPLHDALGREFVERRSHSERRSGDEHQLSIKGGIDLRKRERRIE